MLRVDYGRWGQTPADLRYLALSALHPRSRERFLALHDIAQGSCATEVAERTDRRPHTVMDWLHTYNTPEALMYRRTGPLFVQRSRLASTKPSVPLSGKRPRHRESGLMRSHAGRSSVWPDWCMNGLAASAAAKPSAPPCIGLSCPGKRPRSCSAAPTPSGARRLSNKLLDEAQRDRRQLVYLDEAHIHQDVDLGYGWGERGKRFYGASPGLSAKVSFYGVYLYNEAQVRIWPYPCANGEHTIDVLRRLRTEIPEGTLSVIWDGAPYHRAKAVAAANLNIQLVPLSGYTDAGGTALALAARGRHLSPLPRHR